MYVISKLLLCLASVTAGAVTVEVYNRECQRGPSPDSAHTSKLKPQIAAPDCSRNEIRFEGQTAVSANRVARVTFKEGERVFEVAVQPGQMVKPGDLLFTLKGVHLQQSEQAAAHAVAAKKKRLQAATELAAEKKRIVGVVRELLGKGAATVDELRRAESDAVQAGRAVEYHHAQLREQEMIHASTKSIANEEYVSLPEGFRYPSGLVRRVTITPGDMRRGTDFQGVEVVNLDQVIVRTVLPAAERQKLAAARHEKATLKVVASLDGVDWPATLAPHDIDADSATGAVPTVVLIENTNQPRLPIGARVTIRIVPE